MHRRADCMHSSAFTHPEESLKTDTIISWLVIHNLGVLFTQLRKKKSKNISCSTKNEIFF